MPDRDNEEVNRKSAIVYGAVFAILISIVSFLLVGWGLDKLFKTTPWMLVGGIVLGTIVGFIQFVRLISRAS
ncbi:MAG: AtpZ/AtpI family protein [Acidobacteria bacterium]|nr:AtpZ/AtpI family protein [Acidobacteriota bacterium]